MDKFAPKVVLCPVDFSEQSAAALRVAGVIAESLRAEVVVLHVQRLETPVYFTSAQTKALEAQLRRSVRAANKHANEFAKKHLSPKVARRIMVVENQPVSAILKTQKDMGANLIAMGTHGRGGLARIRMGSIAESVLHHAKIPVLTVGPHATIPASLNAPLRRILCPVNFNPSSQVALEHAAALAAATGAELVVAHIEEAPLGKVAQDSLQRLCEWIPAGVRSRCTVSDVVKQGSAAEQIMEVAKQSQADLLVTGAQPSKFLGSDLWGSTTELVIRGAPCPVLSVIGNK
jgi:nucleotide-binding universal stress UspA family protein